MSLSTSLSTERSDDTQQPAAVLDDGAAAAAATAALVQACRDVQVYVESEMNVQSEEWRFVDKCHAALRARYGRLGQRADAVVHSIQEAHHVMSRLPEYYTKVDELLRNLEALELVANGLDTYSKVLEEKYCGGGGPQDLQ